MDIGKVFDIPGTELLREPYGSGHINDTFRVVMEDGGEKKEYVLQRINTTIFRDPAALMENIRCVTEHLTEKIAAVIRRGRRSIFIRPRRESIFMRTSRAPGA